MEKKKTLLLIDGHSVAFRAFYGLHAQLNTFKNRNGLHTNALYGFHNMLETVLKKEQPTHVMVAFDAGKTTFRHAFYEAYKGGRDSMPGEFSEQMPYLKDLLDGFGIVHYQLDNYEADDIIGTLATRAQADEFEVVILTGDRDLTQLADTHIRIDLTRKGVTDIEEITPASLEESTGLTPKQIIDYKGLAGDPSDNIPGVDKVGDKTATKLVKQYGTIENMYAHIDEMKKSKVKENLIAQEEVARLSKKLATIDVNAPIAVEVGELSYSGQNIEKLVQFYKEMDFNSHLRKLDTTEYMTELSEQEEKISYTWVEECTPSMFAPEMSVYIEMLDENYHHSPIVSVGWGTNETHYVAAPDTVFSSPFFKEWAEDSQQRKIVFDAKRTYIACKRHGVKLAGIGFDVLLASYLLTARDNSADLGDLASEHHHSTLVPDEAVYGKGKKRRVPDEKEKMSEHVARKVHMLHVLAKELRIDLQENNQEKLLLDMELPLSLVLANMEWTGITVDAARLEKMQDEFADILTDIEEQVYEKAGETFNLNSPKQLGVILFEKMGYPVIKKTKTGYSTAQDVLEKLQPIAPIVDLILEYRQIAKIQSTYVEGLLKLIDPDTSKVHTRYLQTVARTGRLSSVEPNLQNIPIRTEEGRKIRQAFVPHKKGWKIFASDYSQIELRILAHISEDAHLRTDFIEEQDIHTNTAIRVFDLSGPEDVTPNMRRDAKAVNFGIVYGISDYGLSQNLGITRKEAKGYIDRYFDRYPGVKTYIEDIIRDAKDKGYVETLFHRRRYLPDINARNFNMRSFAERTAMNTPIQGSAADIIKVAMIAMDKKLKEENMQATMLLQVHDELIFEAPEEEIPKLKQLVKDVMERTVELSVPLKVESSVGNSWYEAN